MAIFNYEQTIRKILPWSDSPDYHTTHTLGQFTRITTIPTNRMTAVILARLWYMSHTLVDGYIHSDLLTPQ